MSQNNWKQPLRNTALLGLLGLCTLFAGCVNSPPIPATQRITFNNPPVVGDNLLPQREFVVCQTKQAAIYTASFGFVHFKCTALTELSYSSATVTACELVELKEGPSWLASVKVDEEQFWLPVPWHDWI